MKKLISIRTNPFYVKKDKKNKQDEDTYEKQFELIFLVDKAKYSQTNDNEIIRERGIEELRFIVSENNFDVLIKNLVILKDIDETELTK